MKLITRFKLAAKNTNELYGLHRKVFNELAKSKPQTLENIENELASRAPCP